MSDVATSVVYQLKVSLRGISPMIWRRLLVPEEMTLYALHRAIQIAFGWEDYHLHAFKLHGRRYGTMWTGERHRDAAGREVMLADLQLRLRQRILYEYDFGDLWEHEIRVEAKLEREGGKVYPVCIAGARAGPPEDIGGPGGYEALLDRLSFGDIDRLLRGDDEEDVGEEFEDDDALRAFEPERFSRREVNAELKRELAVADKHSES
ncbi:plasmid pRiA4b ORF-3 family protein [Allomesorhizobium camelthorni]|uniref:Plasmid pRiA4b ORF-3 family protein n=1 Tax=Allomesorhizobium camelthorni TaxID=475069 RepID=A0A6G4WKZ7_9HYPH|nr:plasmid pRiA4b ORF-3 family protein [Mesorhizobium camelthorni]NGO55441.1 plasmid pRiA4b ORF-3 family protein [Mesorhizobium camelthorni]